MDNSAKLVNRLFLGIVVLHMVLIFGLVGWNYFIGTVSFGIVANLLVSQMTVILPAMLYFPISRIKIRQVIPFRKIKVSSVFIIMLFTFLMMPVITLINAFTQLFTVNVVSEIQGAVIDESFLLMFSIVGLAGPFCEEFVFRGIFYHGLKNTGRRWGAILLSAILFGFMHMNLNQMPYAFVIGILFCLLIEATGSIWAPVIGHCMINGFNVILMYAMEPIMQFAEKMQGSNNVINQNMEISTSMLLDVISLYGLVALVSGAIGLCTFIWLCKNENRLEYIKGFLIKKNRELPEAENQKKAVLVTPSLIIALSLAMAYMIYFI